MTRPTQSEELKNETPLLAPGSASEQALAKIWSEVLRLPSVAVDANFFDIGGDSMKAMEVIVRAGETLGIELPLMAFFEDPTIAHLAAVADELKGESAAAPIVRVPGRRKFPLSYSQQVFWLLEQQNAGMAIYNTARIFRVRGKVDAAILERSLNELRSRHEILQVRFLPEADGPVQIVDPGAPLKMGVSDLSSLDAGEKEQEAQKIALKTIREPFDLESGPVLRARLVRLTDDDSLLCIAIHHVVSDGFTGSIFLDELSAIYDAFAESRPSPLPELELHFTDYAAWERQSMDESRIEQDLEYWRPVLSGTPTSVDLPRDFAQSSRTTRRGRLRSITMPVESLQRLQAMAASNGATLFTVLTTAFRTLLYRWSGQADFIIGTIASNRSRSETERMIGCFVNPLPIRNPITDGQNILSLLNSEKTAVMNAFAHQDCPFTKIVEAVNPERTSSDNPLFNVALLLQSFPTIAVNGRCFEAQSVNFDAEVGLLDLRFIAAETATGLQIDCEYSTECFEQATVDSLLSAYVDLLTQMPTLLATELTQIDIPEDLNQRALEYRRSRQTITITANFTAEPVQGPLEFWMKELQIPAKVEFAPFDQIFQQLLNPGSLLARNSEGINIAFVQWRDGRELGEQARELAGALKTAVARGTGTIIVCVCPPAAAAEEQVLATELSGQTGVHLVYPDEILDLYPVENYRDEYADAVGAIPYTQDFYVALASVIARTIHNLRSTPFKVIALDCDNTLWKGVCGEEGPLGVEVDAPRRALQEFMLEQRKAGMLLCLCSKNAEADVAAVFESNPEMLLRSDDFVASRINWRSKSENLKDVSLALKLGMDSFVFVDDNPLECAEVRANCPGTLVLELPHDSQGIPAMLRHVWAFDHRNVTEEDRQRTALYQQEQKREQSRDAAGGLDQFLRSLELKIEIRPMEAEDVARASQLTQRTNQFNCTTIRRSETEITAAVGSGAECLVVEVRDRFGDYGLVGLAIFRVRLDSLLVDTLLMSCRALGRKVEHHILAHLGRIAIERGLQQVDVMFVPTAKNRPALDFLESLGSEFRSTGGDASVYSFPAAYASTAHELTITCVEPSYESSPKATSAPISRRADLARIASELSDVTAIAKAFQQFSNNKGVETSSLKARSVTEEILSGIWATLLRTPPPGIDDDFFRLGGNSLLAVQMISRVRQALRVEMSLRELFEEPTLAGFAHSIETVRRAHTVTVKPPLAKISRTGPMPPSFAQQRLWFIDQLEPGNPLYNIPQMYRLRGELQPEALESAINEIVRRHEALRTTFQILDGQPAQRIAPTLRIPVEIESLTGVLPQEREAEVQSLAKQRALQPFDLANGPLLRATLLKLDLHDHVLLLTLHHIVGDGWSGSLLATELVTLYEAFSQGRTSPLPELTVQYVDFAVWQRGWLQGEVLDAQVSYWSKQLGGAPSVLELPTDRPRPAVQRHHGAIYARVFPLEFLNKLKMLSQAEGVTLFMTLLAGFQLMLARYSGQEDIVVGSPVAGRDYTEIEPLIGFFVNTLALRTDVSGEITFRELLGRVRQIALDAFAHQEIPFERLVEELRPERSLSYNPIFQVLLGLQKSPNMTFKLADIEIERSSVHQSTSAFDLSWFAFEAADGLLVRMEYDTDLFDEATIRRMADHFETLMESAVSHPERHVSDLTLLGEAERNQVIVEFNATSATYPGSPCLHDFVARQAGRTPAEVALVCGDERLSYGELNSRANRLAHYLIQRGAGPEVLIGIHAERSPEMLVGILGILKSGSAYVPLDPKYPKQRLTDILQDSRAPILLTQAAIADELPDFAGLRICLDADWDAICQEPSEDPVTTVAPGNLAYVLFTSGSTGRPKGVAIEHRSVATFVQWAQDVFTPQELSGVLFSTSMCFDLSVFEMFVPLSVGGKIILAENALYLPTLSAKNEVTLINTVPSAMAELVRMAGVPDSVRTVNLAGEALPETLVEQVYSSTRTERLYNLYGPTEDTTYSTYTLVRRGAPVTIGSPITNSQAYILDARLNPVPVGVSGELYLAGEGLARGYYGRPDLTSERFIPNSFNSEPGARMYRTGDLARYLPDGNIEYLGRMDHQVKLRGFRIELGEIENALDSHPRVQQSVVLAREDAPGDKRLVAYIVLNPEHREPDDTQNGDPIPQLRRWLGEQLPEFMIPSAFVLLDFMPLSSNGKINRSVLPAPESSLGDGATYVAPRTHLEEDLVAIWSEVLRVPRIGIYDDFFSLGGHSLLATQVISRIRTSLRVELPLRVMFEATKIAELAARINEVKGTSMMVLPPLQRAPRNEALPLSFAQQRLWFLDQFEPDNPLYNVPLAIRLKGVLHTELLENALNEIIRRHEILRTTYVLQNDRPVQNIAAELTIEVELEDLSTLPRSVQDDAVSGMAIEKGRHTFNLRTGPLLRASLLRLGDEEHILLLNMHHIVTDGWSIWQFVRELAVLYEAFLSGTPTSLRELPIQYADFAVWQRNWFQDEILERQLSYWRQQLEGAADTLELPTDHPRPAVQTYRGTTHRIIYPRVLTDTLNELSRREGVTLFMTLLAAYQTLLFRYSGQEDISVGSPIANRSHSELEGLIGFFVNSVVMRTDLSGNPTFRDVLHRVRAIALGAYSNQDLPFERLVEELRPERDMSRTPLFQVWFALQNSPRTAFELPGIQISGMDIHNGTSKFDLGLFMVEKPEGLVCTVEYSTDLLEAATIQRMLCHLQILLESVVEDPEGRIGELPLLPAKERQQILLESNDTYQAFPRNRSLHEFIEQQVELTPDAPALVFESEQLSYRELNGRANQLAHRLRKLGVGPEKLVAICANRSIEMVVGLLGTMKAGGAYVPLDPEHPRNRLGVMLADAEPPVLLTLEGLLDVLPEHEVPTICLDRDWHTLSSEPTTNPPIITNGKDQAYLIYTSGSTGKPKGVPNVHEGIVNRLLWMQAEYKLNATDRVLQKTPYSFDVSVWEFFWPLMTGACLVVARPQGHKDPNYLVNLIADQNITTIHFVPSMLRIFLESEGVESCTSLRRVICSGEALPYDLQERFFVRLHAELHNLYGPTEAAVDVTYWECKPNSGRTLVPIGRPIWNTQIYILDRYLAPMPFGVAGELHIGGCGLARGYLKQPELTAEKFISDPFSSEPGARLYKTGDLARLMPDGTIEYLGRIDHQVKIRGFRIELGEIEATLDSHPGVRQSVVLAREDQPGDKRLVAYVVPDPNYTGSGPSEAEEELSQEQVSQWAMAFDEAYRQGGTAEEATFNIVGWNSSYTLEPIPADDMRVWVEATVDRVRALHPKRILEIGCGTGLLLFRLAPGADLYKGTDISQTALDFLQACLLRPELRLPQVILERKPAHEFENETEVQFDAVVMNSVIQYFPDLDYFMEVLSGAVRSVRPGGTVFIGDIRNLSLLEAFHVSVQLFQAPDSLTRTEFLQRVQKGIEQEGELLIDPALFAALRRRLPQISYVELQMKRGRMTNELTRFRYDVVLHIGEVPPPTIDCAWLDWKKQGLSQESLREIIQKTEPEMLGVTGVPNARLQSEVDALRMLTSEDAPITIGALRETLKAVESQGVEPEDLWDMEKNLPYRVEIRPSTAVVDGCFDVVFRRVNSRGEVAHFEVPRFPGEIDSTQPWAAYANNPMRQRAVGKLVPQLRLWAGAKLPEYMLPSAFVLLDGMPLTSSGKVNRRALPKPDQHLGQDPSGYTAPQTPTEEIVAAIFADVLRIEQVGIHDNFFELGGHSLSATQATSRIRQSFKIEMQVRALFESPSVATLSQSIELMLRGKLGLVAPPIVPVARSAQLPLSFAQQRLWVQDQLEPNSALYNIPRAIRLTGHLNVNALQEALNGIVARHEILRTTYASSDEGHPFQVIAPELRLPLTVVDLSQIPSSEREKEARHISQEEASRPFNLMRDPITRNLLVKIDEEDHILLMTTHHIASDGWSTGILLRELTALYKGALTGEAASLPELPIQYADFAVWQREWLQGDILDQQLNYWRSRLEGAPPLLALPTDRPRPATPTFRGEIHQFALPAGLADAIRSLSRQNSATSFMTMLAGFQSLMFHYTKQPDIVLGTDLANRTNVETESLIGFFVNLLPMRTDLSGDPSFEELLGRVREVAFGSYAHQDLPFDKLVEELQPERSRSHNPVVQVLFVQQNTPRTATAMPGIDMTPYMLDMPSKFDMAVFVTETDKGIAGTWLYNPDLFDATTIARMAGLFRLGLEKATANPAMKLSDLTNALREAEQQDRASQHKEFQAVGLQKLKSVKRKVINRD
jgi:amino acid adenylation domain-containing protein/FkbH-like protein